jgi:hypothetical protein
MALGRDPAERAMLTNAQKNPRSSAMSIGRYAHTELLIW